MTKEKESINYLCNVQKLAFDPFFFCYHIDSAFVILNKIKLIKVCLLYIPTTIIFLN